MTTYKKLLIGLGSLLVIAALLYGASFLLVRPGSPSTANIVTLEGTLVCLPHADKTSPQTQECAIGLQDDNQEYYGLKHLPASYPAANSSVKVKGTLSEPATNEIYDVAGNIDVTSIVKE